MPVPGLTTILKKNRDNFRPFHLRDTKVIINANDFVSCLESKLKNPGDLEAVGLYLSIKRILSAFTECGIIPYFVFTGGNDERGSSL
ncbi:hypothetical protein CRM22_000398 [Opisthorchis felineus]|uniref:XPG N-terminal domain-containing protein n=1 Tax=Opisthorchis felineus TaxID=147828 RepID=A0A4S2MF81_OPIFE|nr:hypothetical protein CRM22_000398 [Opisthorchis felineus]